MADVSIRYKDGIRFTINAETAILREIKEKFSFYANGYKFSPKYKYGTWDGKVSMLNIRDKSFYHGLLPELFKFLNDSKYSVNFDDKKMYLPQKPFDESFISQVPGFGKYPLKDYQEFYIAEGLKRNKALILSPTASGKSYTIYCMIRYILTVIEPNEKVLINVPSISLVEQMYSDFEDYTMDDFDVKSVFTKIYSGKKADPNARVHISTWQTTANQPIQYFKDFNAYFVDEAHQAKSAEISKIIDNMPYLDFRFGFTGTLDGGFLHEIEMKARFGSLLKKVTTAELMERGDVAKMEIECHTLKYNIDDCKFINKTGTQYQDEVDYILGHEKRNAYLINTALNLDKNTLMLFNYVDKHGKIILDTLQKEGIKHLKKVYFIYKDVKGDEREKIRKLLDSDAPEWYDITFENGCILRVDSSEYIMLENGKKVSPDKLMPSYKLNEEWYNNFIKSSDVYVQNSNVLSKIKKIEKKIGSSILLASYGTMSTGVSIKNLHYLIFCHPLKKQIRLLQSIGRVIRALPGKSTVIVIDIVDDFSYNTKTRTKSNYTLKHFIERIKVYEKESFKYKILKHNL